MSTKKRTLVFASIALMALLFTACKKNGTTNDSDLNLSFQSRLNGANYIMNQTYRNAANTYDLQFQLIQFYLSDLTLINSDDEERSLSEIVLVKLNENGFASLDFEAPRGKYKAIRFGLGVKKELNESDPADFSEADHPLNVTQSTYWGWASMYRFITLEGRYDEDLNGEYEGTFAYHTGYSDSYKTVTLNHDFEIKKKDLNQLAFEIDVFSLFNAVGNEVDVPADPYYHGGFATFYLVERISANLEAGLSIRE